MVVEVKKRKKAKLLGVPPIYQEKRSELKKIIDDVSISDVVFAYDHITKANKILSVYDSLLSFRVKELTSNKRMYLIAI
ncbi:MAG: hypothetical protein HOL58_01865 [Francisellaceae bacterium]|nr:hypothetical protein [Francisellaceae bacterium]